ncbi:hypothetical protein OWV82_006678 [Melia azedarach]|uniref:Uncharacterized protein n=1 Tax=Melia azedarach TaxID=155640 RepID=A0ACC1YHM6_MELAZ|nr:hypothetical protein OWV82_006678 [Melia azedarach]
MLEHSPTWRLIAGIKTKFGESCHTGRVLWIHSPGAGKTSRFKAILGLGKLPIITDTGNVEASVFKKVLLVVYLTLIRLL